MEKYAFKVTRQRRIFNDHDVDDMLNDAFEVFNKYIVHESNGIVELAEIPKIIKYRSQVVGGSGLLSLNMFHSVTGAFSRG
jgi:hypothetical protein